MRNLVKTGAVVLMSSSVLFAGAGEIKLYDIKSGKIEYSIKGSGKIMAGQTMQVLGKKIVIFDNNGAINLTEESNIEKLNIMGQKKINKSHTLSLMKGSVVYTVNFRQKRIMRMPNMAISIGGKDIKKNGEEMLKKMGGKKVGTDKVLEYLYICTALHYS